MASGCGSSGRPFGEGSTGGWESPAEDKCTVRRGLTESISKGHQSQLHYVTIFSQLWEPRHLEFGEDLEACGQSLERGSQACRPGWKQAAGLPLQVCTCSLICGLLSYVAPWAPTGHQQGVPGCPCTDGPLAHTDFPGAQCKNNADLAAFRRPEAPSVSSLRRTYTCLRPSTVPTVRSCQLCSSLPSDLASAAALPSQMS